MVGRVEEGGLLRTVLLEIARLLLSCPSFKPRTGTVVGIKDRSTSSKRLIIIML